MEFLTENWLPLALGLMGLAKVVVNLTPSEKDNEIFAIIDKLFNAFVPNLKKGGGKHDKK